MQRMLRNVSLGLLAATLAALVANAAGPRIARPELRVEPSADLMPDAQARRLARTARHVSGGAPSTAAAEAAPTADDVGDVDSFGRAVRWLGVTQMNVALSSTCPPPGGDPSAACAVLSPAPATTAFAFNDVARIRLPGKSAESLLCYWLSPVLAVSYDNPTASAATALLAYSPTLTVESTVLDDPAMIDPNTGLPFGGRLLTAMTSSERFEVPLGAGQQLASRTRDSAVCIAGFISRRTLVANYGLTPAQATEFFKRPITVRMNISGSARLVQDANLIFGFRIVGD